jgi:hypothetical protein
MASVIDSILEIIFFLFGSIMSTLGTLGTLVDKLINNVSLITGTTLGLVIAVLVLALVLFLLAKFVMGNVKYLLILIIIGFVILVALFLF